MNAPTRPQAEPAHLGWRLLSLTYDLLPVLALWMLASVVVLALRGGAPIAPWSAAFWLQNLALWGLTGVYAVESWRRGGQTMGMRPWRLRVVAADGSPPNRAALWQRYGWATLSLAVCGIGFLWSLIDAERRGWHDIASGTQLVRIRKQ
jgi:uncharacterized RDD family membrane protein YckC